MLTHTHTTCQFHPLACLPHRFVIASISKSKQQRHLFTLWCRCWLCLQRRLFASLAFANHARTNWPHACPTTLLLPRFQKARQTHRLHLHSHHVVVVVVVAVLVPAATRDSSALASCARALAGMRNFLYPTRSATLGRRRRSALFSGLYRGDGAATPERAVVAGPGAPASSSSF